MPGIIDQNFNVIQTVLTIIIIGIISWTVIKIIKNVFKRYLEKININSKDNYFARSKYTQVNIFKNILIVLIIIIPLSLGLLTIDSTKGVGLSILGSAGIISVIVVLSAQKVIATVIAGFQIAVTHLIHQDDVVIINNEWGWIEEINLTYVVVRIWDKRRLIVPAACFIENIFQNRTRKTVEMLGTVHIYIDYAIPIQMIREKMTEFLQENKYWDGKVNVLQVTDTTRQGIELRTLISAADSPTLWNLRVSIREQLIDFIQKEYPQSLPNSRIRIMDGDVNK